MNKQQCPACGGQGFVYRKPIVKGGRRETCGRCGGSGQR